ncbi:MAG: hypothetical protein QOD99_752 [Chthoniobacter sp.]|nr:hypothetical protein [Chthoniobacter sp.]
MTNSRNSSTARDVGGRTRARQPAQALGRCGRRFFRFFDQAANSIARLRTLPEPVVSTIEVDAPVLAGLFRVVNADLLDEFSVTRAAAVRDDDFIVGIIE